MHCRPSVRQRPQTGVVASQRRCLERQGTQASETRRVVGAAFWLMKMETLKLFSEIEMVVEETIGRGGGAEMRWLVTASGLSCMWLSDSRFPDLLILPDSANDSANDSGVNRSQSNSA